DLAFGRKALVKPFIAEGSKLFGPGGESFAPALHAAFFRFGLAGGQINANPNHRFERHRFGDHVSGVAPGLAPYFRRGLKEVPDHSVVALRAAFVRALALNFWPGLLHPAMNLV